MFATSAAAVVAEAPAVGSAAESQGKILQAEINEPRGEVAALKGEIDERQREARTSAKQSDGATNSRGDKASFRMSSGNRPTICSADERNCVSLTSRLDLDFGGYNYRPDSPATIPQTLVGGLIARRARIGITGNFLGDWGYALVFERGGSGGTPSAMIDKAYLTYSGFRPLTVWGGILTVPYSLDRATSSTDITFMERAAPEEVASGIAAGNRSALGVTADGRRWWSGAFLTGRAIDKTAKDAGQTAVTARAVFLPVLTNHASLLIGGDAQYLFVAPTGSSKLNLRDRIELRIDGDRVLGTGPLQIDSARVLSAELAGTLRSFHFQGEYFNFEVLRPPGKGGSLYFNGYYLQAGYALSGEARNYRRRSGSYGGISPSRPFDWNTGGWGAWEIAARYSIIDLNDKDVLGGRQENVTLGLNWYVNNNLRFMLNYINGKVEKRSATGGDIGAKYQAFAGRAQIVF